MAFIAFGYFKIYLNWQTIVIILVDTELRAYFLKQIQHVYGETLQERFSRFCRKFVANRGFYPFYPCSFVIFHIAL